jgi:hypothetical protein
LRVILIVRIDVFDFVVYLDYDLEDGAVEGLVYCLGIFLSTYFE